MHTVLTVEQPLSNVILLTDDDHVENGAVQRRCSITRHQATILLDTIPFLVTCLCLPVEPKFAAYPMPIHPIGQSNALKTHLSSSFMLTPPLPVADRRGPSVFTSGASIGRAGGANT